MWISDVSFHEFRGRVFWLLLLKNNSTKISHCQHMIDPECENVEFSTHSGGKLFALSIKCFISAVSRRKSTFTFSLKSMRKCKSPPLIRICRILFEVHRVKCEKKKLNTKCVLFMDYRYRQGTNKICYKQIVRTNLHTLSVFRSPFSFLAFGSLTRSSSRPFAAERVKIAWKSINRPSNVF